MKHYIYVDQTNGMDFYLDTQDILMYQREYNILNGIDISKEDIDTNKRKRIELVSVGEIINLDENVSMKNLNVVKEPERGKHGKV